MSSSKSQNEDGEPEQIHFVTGRLAEHSLRSTLEPLAAKAGFEYTIQVMPISVAALMTPDWVAKRLQIPKGTNKVLLPGYCDGDLQELHKVCQVPVVIGPKDLRRLPKFFGEKSKADQDYGAYDIEIIAEINHAPKLELAEILRQANELSASGADFIDVGCIPNSTWHNAGECVKALIDEGLRVSIDSLNPKEIELAARAGAELVLSVNSSNRDAALDWGIEVVVIPDQFENLEGLDETVELLASAGVQIRIDPVLEPIGCGFAKSLIRYAEVRQRYPDAEMMMGIGNLTELTDADSAGINVLLLGFCQELGIRSVLTTEVINWARTSVKECDLARRLVHHAIDQGIPPKHIEPNLVMLRDPEVLEYTTEQLEELAAQIRDSNYRIFLQKDLIHLIGGGRHIHDSDPFEVFDKLADQDPKKLDASHAFYLGYEMCKAMIAANLGKEYRQDQSLNWGMLTKDEKDRRRLKKSIERKREKRK